MEGAQRVEEWHDFFLAAAGAAAVLAGLVFVGVSINLDTIMSNPTYGLAGRALEALVLLVAVLIATILLLVPDQRMVLAGAELLAVGVVDWAAVVTIQVLVLRNWRSLEPAFRWHFVPRVVLCQLATLPIVAAGIGVMGWELGGLYLLVVGVVLSFLVAVGDAWVLLVEIHR
jgi:modulator of FtsH protease